MPRPKLRIVNGRAAGETYWLQEETLIGRDPGNHIQIRDASASRHHARIEVRDAHALLKDLGSNNGTFVNGARLEQEHLLGSGDRIRIGRVEMHFEWHDPVPDSGDSTAALRTVGSAETGASTETQYLRAALSESGPLPSDPAYQRLKRLYEISRHLAAELEAAPLARRLLETTLGDLDADVAAMLYFSHTGDEEVMLRARKGLAETGLRAPRSLLEQSMTEKKALRFDSAPAAAPRKIASALVAPVQSGQTVLGALYADRRGTRDPFTQGDLEFLSILAAQSSVLLENALRFERSRERARHLEGELPGFGAVVGKSPRFIEALALATKAAESEASVLLEGETGTGKEIVARMIHRASSRADGPFVAINCAALVETLLESELFGHEKGAFTGAVGRKAGCFESADGGTLFLDEIAEMSPATQAKLLRAIQEQSFYRVGGTEAVKVDVRIVAATNRDLAAAVAQHVFREDLFFRLGVIVVRLPALRERSGDIPLLAYHFLEHFGHQIAKPVRAIRSDVMKLLEAYRWPGNIRELQNVIERAVVLSEGPEVGPEQLPIELRGAAAAGTQPFPVSLKEAEKLCIQRALKQTRGKKGEAAKLLGISWPTLNKKIEDYGIQVGPDPPISDGLR